MAEDRTSCWLDSQRRIYAGLLVDHWTAEARRQGPPPPRLEKLRDYLAFRLRRELSRAWP
jgi:hypothetical protein